MAGERRHSDHAAVNKSVWQARKESMLKFLIAAESVALPNRKVNCFSAGLQTQSGRRVGDSRTPVPS